MSAAITHKNQIPHWQNHHQSAVAINFNFATYASMPSFMFINLYIFSEILTSKNEIPLLGPFWIAFPFQEDHYTCLLKIPSVNGQHAIQHSPNLTKIFNSHLNFLADFKESCEAASCLVTFPDWSGNEAVLLALLGLFLSCQWFTTAVELTQKQ